MRRLLSADADRQLTEARELLASLRDSLIRFGASSADETTLARSIRQLDEFFLLVVVGEFNASKSAFINALVGQSVLQEGVTPTTDRIHLLAYGPKTDLQDKVSALRIRLTDTLHGEFERAQERSAERIGVAVAPYARFVTSEDERWKTASVQLTALRDRAAAFLAAFTSQPASTSS